MIEFLSIFQQCGKSEKRKILGGSLAISGGPLIGGALVDSMGWRSIFLVNIPFGITAILLGISNALVNPPIANAAMSSVDKKQVGMASGILNVFRQVGISFGVVMLGIKLTEGYNQSLDKQIMGISKYGPRI